MAIDLDALVELLRQQPEQRAALRQVLFGDQPDLGAALAALTELQQRTDDSLQALAEAQRRSESRLDALAKDVQALTVAQRATEETLKSLLDVVAGMQDRLGKLDGDALERRYRERGQAYLAPIARRLRLVDGNELAALVDDGEQAGTLTAAEAQSVVLADVVFAGRRRSDEQPVHLVVEASVTVGRADVRRARERADLLARLIDTPVLAVVAGEFAPEPVRVAAQDADVWCVTDGRVLAPTDDLDDGPA